MNSERVAEDMVRRRLLCVWTGLPCECIRGSVAEAHCLAEAEKLVPRDAEGQPDDGREPERHDVVSADERKWPDDFRGFGIHVKW